MINASVPSARACYGSTVRKEKPSISSPLATSRTDGEQAPRAEHISPDMRKGTSAPGSSRVLEILPSNYRADPLCPRVERAVLAILTTKTFVAPVDVLVGMGVLRAKDLEDWRCGRIPYLERVTQGNLSKLRRILRILGFLCHDLHLGASTTAYVRWGKGPRIPLRFTKTSEEKLEKIYARHFVWPGKIPFHLPVGYQVFQKAQKLASLTAH